MKLFLMTLIFILSTSANANLHRTAWVGTSELLLNDKVHCSSDEYSNPSVLTNDESYLTLHVSYSKWIWPIISKGCALGWLKGYLPLKIQGNKLIHKSGTAVGSITNNTIEAFNFTPNNERIFIKELKFHSYDLENIEVTVIFTHIEIDGEFTFKSVMKRHRGSFWQ
ncbi:MAG: hypothetical protein VX341_12380 [Bdellovibrionota bacterium]|nr:hypothetical protein [Bdellovibrionota bacterium]